MTHNRDPYELGNGTLSAVKDGQFLDQMREYQLLNKYATVWS
jgi:hypothetical protein